MKFSFFSIKDMHCWQVLTFLWSPLESLTFYQNSWKCYYFLQKKNWIFIFWNPLFSGVASNTTNTTSRAFQQPWLIGPSTLVFFNRLRGKFSWNGHHTEQSEKAQPTCIQRLEKLVLVRNRWKQYVSQWYVPVAQKLITKMVLDNSVEF